MKKSFLIISFIVLSLHSFSQSLAGRWKGTFTSSISWSLDPNAMWKNDFTLDITLNKDSTYTIFSTAGLPVAPKNPADYVCQMIYEIYNDNTLYLEEATVVKPQNKRVCFKKMELRIIKHRSYTSLEGFWRADSDGCDVRGKIYLYRK